MRLGGAGFEIENGVQGFRGEHLASSPEKGSEGCSIAGCREWWEVEYQEGVHGKIPLQAMELSGPPLRGGVHGASPGSPGLGWPCGEAGEWRTCGCRTSAGSQHHPPICLLLRDCQPLTPSVSTS